MAKFHERAGKLHGLGGEIFAYWAQKSSYQVIYAESVDMDKSQDAELLLAHMQVVDLYIKDCFDKWE